MAVADTREGRRFYLPVYKSQTGLNPGDAGYGEIIEAGDTVSVLTTSADGVIREKDLTVIAVAADGKEIYWEYDAGNLYTHSESVIAVQPKHQFSCPPIQNIGITGTSFTAAVTSITINGVVHTVSPSIAVSANGATELQELLNTLLNRNGEATVVYVDAATDYYKFYVMGTTATVTINATALTALP